MRVERQIQYKIDADPKIFKKTDTGLIVSAALTRAGIFEYSDGKGGAIREFRSPDEVFNQDSLDSLKLIPITNKHPKKMVDLDNIKNLQIGMTGENIGKTDENRVKATLKITDKQSIKDIEDRKTQGRATELSCGYSAEVIMQDGESDEGKYDAIQKNIRYNHLAIVDVGRAGPTVRIDKKEKVMSMIKIKKDAVELPGEAKLDAFDIEIPKEAEGVVNQLFDRIDELIQMVRDKHKQGEKLTADKDNADNILKTKEKELKEAKEKVDGLTNPNSPEMQAIMKDYSDLVNLCKEKEVKTDEVSVSDMKVALIKKLDADFDPKDKSDIYLAARYDAAIATFKKEKKDAGLNKQGAFRKKVLDAAKSTSEPDENDPVKKADEALKKLSSGGKL